MMFYETRLTSLGLSSCSKCLLSSSSLAVNWSSTSTKVDILVAGDLCGGGGGGPGKLLDWVGGGGGGGAEGLDTPGGGGGGQEGLLTMFNDDL